MVEENILGLYQNLQKIYREKVCRMNVFSNKFGKFGQNILCTCAKVPSILPAQKYLSLISVICAPAQK